MIWPKATWVGLAVAVTAAGCHIFYPASQPSDRDASVVDPSSADAEVQFDAPAPLCMNPPSQRVEVAEDKLVDENKPMLQQLGDVHLIESPTAGARVGIYRFLIPPRVTVSKIEKVELVLLPAKFATSCLGTPNAVGCSQCTSSATSLSAVIFRTGADIESATWNAMFLTEYPNTRPARVELVAGQEARFEWIQPQALIGNDAVITFAVRAALNGAAFPVLDKSSGCGQADPPELPRRTAAIFLHVCPQ